MCPGQPDGGRRDRPGRRRQSRREENIEKQGVKKNVDLEPLGLLLYSSVPLYGVGTLIVTGKCQGLYILHHGKLTAVGGRFLYARHLENVVFDWGGLPLRP